MNKNTENPSDRLDSLVYEYVQPISDRLAPCILGAYPFGVHQPKNDQEGASLDTIKKYIQNQQVQMERLGALYPPPKGRGFTARRDKTRIHP